MVFGVQFDYENIYTSFEARLSFHKSSKETTTAVFHRLGALCQVSNNICQNTRKSIPVRKLTEYRFIFGFQPGTSVYHFELLYNAGGGKCFLLPVWTRKYNLILINYAVYYEFF